jgi:hypothetical protein
MEDKRDRVLVHDPGDKDVNNGELPWADRRHRRPAAPLTKCTRDAWTSNLRSFPPLLERRHNADHPLWMRVGALDTLPGCSYSAIHYLLS